MNHVSHLMRSRYIVMFAIFCFTNILRYKRTGPTYLSLAYFLGEGGNFPSEISVFTSITPYYTNENYFPEVLTLYCKIFKLFFISSSKLLAYGISFLNLFCTCLAETLQRQKQTNQHIVNLMYNFKIRIFTSNTTIMRRWGGGGGGRGRALKHRKF